jgi:hypothetical protein
MDVGTAKIGLDGQMESGAATVDTAQIPSNNEHSPLSTGQPRPCSGTRLTLQRTMRRGVAKQLVCREIDTFPSVV